MRRQIPLAHQLYTHLYPHPTPSDPPTFSAHLAKHLVPEVRIEVATFYGDLNSTEARYPGLDYCHPPHRMRLARFRHHRRLFEAFDTLGLSWGEIQDFCCWEGTRWARERFERDEGIKVKDTTGDEIGPFVDRRRVARERSLLRRGGVIARKTDVRVVVEEREGVVQMRLREQQQEQDSEMSDVHTYNNTQRPPTAQDLEVEDADEDEEEETPEQAEARQQHIAELHRRRDFAIFSQRLQQAARGGAPLPPELEQFLKEQTERAGAGGAAAAAAEGSGEVLQRLMSVSALMAAGPGNGSTGGVVMQSRTPAAGSGAAGAAAAA